jgi:hypothetical protein
MASESSDLRQLLRDELNAITKQLKEHKNIQKERTMMKLSKAL